MTLYEVIIITKDVRHLTEDDLKLVTMCNTYLYSFKVISIEDVTAKYFAGDDKAFAYVTSIKESTYLCYLAAIFQDTLIVHQEVNAYVSYILFHSGGFSSTFIDNILKRIDLLLHGTVSLTNRLLAEYYKSLSEDAVESYKGYATDFAVKEIAKKLGYELQCRPECVDPMMNARIKKVQEYLQTSDDKETIKSLAKLAPEEICWEMCISEKSEYEKAYVTLCIKKKIEPVESDKKYL